MAQGKSKLAQAQEAPAAIAEEQAVNTYGDPSNEFASVTLEMNELQAIDDRVLQQVTYGSDTAAEAVRHILGRNGRLPELDEMATIVAATEVAALIVIPPHKNDPRTYAVIDMAAWREVFEDEERGNGTIQGTVACFVTYLTEVLRVNKAMGKPPYQIGAWLSE